MATDPYRTVPGETYSQRSRRIRAETQQGRAGQLNQIRPSEMFGPRGYDETNLHYGGRSLFTSALENAGPAVVGALRGGDVISRAQEMATPYIQQGVNAVTGTLGNMFSYLGDSQQAADQRKAAARQVTPARQQPRPQQAAPSRPASTVPWPNSFRDPAYDRYEQDAAREFGVPPELLRTIRVNGERSNNNQVSSAGARSVYQIIPSTAQGISKNYGFDPLSSPLNAARGAAALLKENLARYKGDQTMAIRAYHGGHDQSRWGPVNAAYAQRTMGGGGSPFAGDSVGMGTPFDDTYYQQALGAVDQATRLASQPVTNVFDMPTGPEMPRPDAMPTTDFAAADKALADMRPIEMTELERSKVIRQNVWGTLGQALMQAPEGAGLGKVLAVIGGSMMAGRARGESEVLERQDRFEAKMAQWRAANFSNEQQKAQISSREAVAQWQADTDFAFKSWAQAAADFKQRNNFSLTGNGDLVLTKDMGNGQVQTKVIPNAAAAQAHGALQKAEILGQMAGQANVANRQVDQMERSHRYSMLQLEASRQYMQQQGGGDSPDGFVGAAGVLARDVVKYGQVPTLLGSVEAANAVRQRVEAKLAAMGIAKPDPMLAPSGSAIQAYQERVEDMMAAELMVGVLQDPTGQLMQRMMGAARPGAAMRQADRLSGSRETTKVDPRGRTTRTTIFDGE